MIPDHIIIHHSLTPDGDTVSWNAIRTYHLSLGWAEIGYHFGIETIKGHDEIFMGRMPDQPGAHCKQQAMNFRSLGICLVGDYDATIPTDAKLTLLAKLTRSLQAIYKIPSDKVRMHREFATYKSCPGKLFPWDRFKSLLEV